MNDLAEARKSRETYTIWDSGWTMRICPPIETGADQLIVLLHGWTGDEHSMEVFTPYMPPTATLLFPRAPISAQQAGYGWLVHTSNKLPSIDEFFNVSRVLMKRIEAQVADLGLQIRQLSLVGFSQGAVLSLAIGCLFPTQVERTAILAGFMPAGISEAAAARPLANKPFFLAHGTKDKIVPIEQAHILRKTLQECGAEVTFCESNTGHKLSSGCLRMMADFFRLR